MPFPRLVSTILTVGVTARAAVQGFNYGSTFTDGSAKLQADFETDFKAAAALPGTNGGFTSARLYTMVQGGTSSDVIQAVPAAIATNTTLLFGLWASGTTFANELTALKSAISTYGSSLGPVVVGISVGSEDLYRNSPTGIEAGSDVGAGPDTIVDYIKQVKTAISGTSLANASIGHVDTWTAWVNSSNSAVIDAVDWIGFDGYPYFQNTEVNAISDGLNLFNDAVANTKAAVGSKPVWITETGWPISGKEEGQGVASVTNAKTYWDQVGCGELFGQVNTWWYVLQDASPTTPDPSFGILGDSLTTPLFDLSCANISVTTSSISSKATSSATGTAAAGVATATGSSSTAGSGAGSASTFATGTATGSPTSSATQTVVTAAAHGYQNGAYGVAWFAVIFSIFAL